MGRGDASGTVLLLLTMPTSLTAWGSSIISLLRYCRPWLGVYFFLIRRQTGHRDIPVFTKHVQCCGGGVRLRVSARGPPRVDPRGCRDRVWAALHPLGKGHVITWGTELTRAIASPVGWMAIEHIILNAIECIQEKRVPVCGLHGGRSALAVGTRWAACACAACGGG
jgi:hypothetical protein